MTVEYLHDRPVLEWQEHDCGDVVRVEFHHIRPDGHREYMGKIVHLKGSHWLAGVWTAYGKDNEGHLYEHIGNMTYNAGLVYMKEYNAQLIKAEHEQEVTCDED